MSILIFWVRPGDSERAGPFPTTLHKIFLHLLKNAVFETKNRYTHLEESKFLSKEKISYTNLKRQFWSMLEKIDNLNCSKNFYDYRKINFL